MNKEIEEIIEERLNHSRALFYGELEYYLDKYLLKFFSVEIRDVGFNDNHRMNNLEFWFTLSWLNEMHFLEYGTSPRGAWLTEDGKKFKNYILKGGTISNILHKEN